MRKYLAALVLGAMMLSAPACQPPHPELSTQQVALLNAREAYIAGTTTAIQAYHSGLISHEAWVQDVNPLIQDGASILADIQTAKEQGDFSTLDALTYALNLIVSRLNAEVSAQ